MATIDFITKGDLEQFKQELFAELRFSNFRLPKQNSNQCKEWLKSYEVRKLLGISPGTLQTLRNKGTIRFSKVGGLMFYRYEDIYALMDEKAQKS